MSSDNPSERFKLNLIILIDIISDMFEEGYENKIVKNDFKILGLLKIIINKYDGSKMLTNFIKKTNLYWEKIRDKDLDYFKDLGLQLFDIARGEGLEKYKSESNDDFFKSLSSSHVDNFRILLEGEYEVDGEKLEILDDERKADIWKILHSFVRISIVYIHQERKYQDGKYNANFFPDISVRENIDKWEIKSIKF